MMNNVPYKTQTAGVKAVLVIDKCWQPANAKLTRSRRYVLSFAYIETKQESNEAARGTS
jgi:hypothetical protein